MPETQATMTLPVSKYEELLRTVRSLKQQTIRVRQLASPLLDTIVTANERLATSASAAPGHSNADGERWDARTYQVSI